MLESPIPYQLIRAKRRTIQISIESNCDIIVRAPRWVSLSEIQAFVDSKRQWLIKKRAIIRSKPKHELANFQEGNVFLYLGQRYTLTYSNNQHIELKEQLHFPQIHLDNAKNKIVQWYQHKALELIPQRVEYYASILQAQYGRITITSAKTRWGSCSSRGNLAFSWKLIMAPLEVIDYIVVHELCHLEHHNHSKRFWQKVERYMPGFKQQEKWLKENNTLLNID